MLLQFYFSNYRSFEGEGILEEYLASNTKTEVKRNEEYTYIFRRERNQKLYLDSSIEKFRENLVSFINSFDDSIIDIEVEKISVIDESDSDNYRVFTVHKSDKETSIARISMNEESSGIKKMFSLYQTLLDVLEKGTVFFAD